MSNNEKILDARDLAFSYESTEILAGLDIDVDSGKIVSLVGQNGAGKTTLLKVLAGLLSASHGDILLAGISLKTLSHKDRAMHIAYMPQELPVGCSLTLSEFISLGNAASDGWLSYERSEKTTKDTVAIIEQLGLEQYAQARVYTLSGGQLQLAVFGQCILQSPRLLLLDEPFSHLDIRYQVLVSKMIREWVQSTNGSVLMSMHDLNIAASVSDQIIGIANGTTPLSGKPSDICSPDNLSSLFDCEFSVVNSDGGLSIFPSGLRKTSN